MINDKYAFFARSARKVLWVASCVYIFFARNNQVLLNLILIHNYLTQSATVINAVAQLIEELFYNSEFRGFDSRWSR
jgi:hypothetical protein